MYSCEFCELFKNTCFVEDLQTAGFDTPGRSSRLEVFCEKGLLRNFGKIIKIETLAQVSSCEFRKISKNTFFYRTPLVNASDQSRGVSSIKLQA